ncbi:hypothetical protein RE9431_16160 [Prescottella equi]|nr:hypothetical protein RE9431_16160 [Prescottella equi]
MATRTQFDDGAHPGREAVADSAVPEPVHPQVTASTEHRLQIAEIVRVAAVPQYDLTRLDAAILEQIEDPFAVADVGVVMTEDRQALLGGHPADGPEHPVEDRVMPSSAQAAFMIPGRTPVPAMPSSHSRLSYAWISSSLRQFRKTSS